MDIDGDAWLNPPSIGCDEFNSASAIGPLTAAISETFSNVIPGFTVDFVGQVFGHATANRWDFGDGTSVSNEMTWSHSWSAAGHYAVTFTAFNTEHPTGASASVAIFVLQNPVQYVALSNATPVAPYLSWATAATNIQDAVDAGFVQGTIIVSNGVYQTGWRVLNSSTNRVVIMKPLTLQSANGAGATIIDGGHTARCLYLADQVSVDGFTLQNGTEMNGGGVFCQSSNEILSDCVLAGNSSVGDGSGGGAFGGVLNRCTLRGNAADYAGGGAEASTLNQCVLAGNAAGTYGGGADSSALSNCALTNNLTGTNSAPSGGQSKQNTPGPLFLVTSFGGGAANSMLTNCQLVGNSSDDGGGVYSCTASNCLLMNNSATFAGAAESSTLNNCTLTANSASDSGGGTYGGTSYNSSYVSNSATYGGGAFQTLLVQSLLSGNSAGATGGGVELCTASNCTLAGNVASGGGGTFLSGGGGADGSALINCILTSNTAALYSGGGASGSSLTNCVLTGNSAAYGGGAGFSTLINCTITGNSAGWGGGVFGGTVDNCIVYYNSGANGMNYAGRALAAITWNYSCTIPLPEGNGVITNDPGFLNLANLDFHLQSNSPCVNSGQNSYISLTNDIEGNPRIVGGTVDLGAYEYQNPASVISYAWLQQYGLPTDGSADYIDSDGDGMNNWQEWIAGTDPTNPLSVLKMLAASNSLAGMTVLWESVNTRSYYVQSSTNLAVRPAFSTIQSDIVGQAGTTSWLDTTGTNRGPHFYRVGVQP